MTDVELHFGEEFALATHSQWRDLVDKVLKGADFDRKLVSRTAEGIDLQPLYTASTVARVDEPTGFGTFTRGTGAARAERGAWDIRSRIRCNDVATVAEANAVVLNELESGATSVELIVSKPGTDLEALLDGVLLELADVALNASTGAFELAEALQALWEHRGTEPAARRGCLGLSPLSELAASGFVVGSLEASFDRIAELISSCESSPLVNVVRINTEPIAAAGAHHVQQLASALAMATETMREVERRGIAASVAAAKMRWTLVADAEMFQTIATVRAFRRTWSTVLSACGITPTPEHFKIEVVSSASMMTSVDPWVNMLRTTSAAAGAVLANADTVTIEPFDVACGASDEFGRRIARNTQLILAEESHLGVVSDPAGGSYFVEQLTNELAERAWALFQEYDSAGGFSAVLTSGALATQIDEVVHKRQADVATRKVALTGVSEFPNIEEPTLDRHPHAETDPSAWHGAVQVCNPLEPYRPAQHYEQLRSKAAGHANARIFLANLGPIAAHTTRSTFAKNFFEAGGIVAVTNDGFTDPHELGEAFRVSGCQLAVLCGSDALYGELGVAAAEALVKAGADRVYLAGNPTEVKAALEEAGVHEFVAIGSDVIDVLSRAQSLIGVN